MFEKVWSEFYSIAFKDAGGFAAEALEVGGGTERFAAEVLEVRTTLNRFEFDLKYSKRAFVQWLVGAWRSLANSIGVGH